MEYKINKTSKCTAEITVSVDKNEWDNCVKEAFNKNKNQYRLEGFRPGKVPFNILVKRYGIEIFYENAIDVALMKYYGEILDKEKDLEIVGRPGIDIKEVSENGLNFTLTLTTYPEFEISAYKGLTIESAEVEFNESDVDKEINRKLEQASRWVEATGRASADGDKVTIDYSGSVNGVKFDGGTAEGSELHIGSGSFIPGFEEQVIGMNVGDTKDIKVKFPEEYGEKTLAGKDAIFNIKLHAIKVKELPALDDEFVKDISEFDTLKEYKANVRETLLKNAEQASEYKNDDRIIEAIVNSTQIEIPPQMIEDEIDRIIEEFKMRVTGAGLKLNDYLKYAGLSLEDMRAERKEDAEKSVKTRMILEEIIKKEGIKLEKDDIDNEIAKTAEKVKKSTDEIKKGMKEHEFNALMNKIIADKLFAFLKANNTFTAGATAKPKKPATTAKKKAE
ncbi:MAG: trigger factor [Firmicutes bacterium]|nr:trigger factor [Bacillota bacterium]